MDTMTYFASQSPLTNPAAYAEQVTALPKSVPEICRAIQGLFVDYKEIYKYPIENERILCVNARYISAVIDGVMKYGKGAPLTEVRDGGDKVPATCSDYAHLFVAAARANGIPARKRTGLLDDKVWDVAEYWDGSVWQRVDVTGLVDVTKFVPAAEAWQACRAGRLDSAEFKDNCDTRQTGLGAVRSALMLDLAAMNKVELQLWDRYGWMGEPIDNMDEQGWELLDKAAAVLADADKNFDAVLALYAAREELQVPPVISCDSSVIPPHKVELTF